MSGLHGTELHSPGPSCPECVAEREAEHRTPSHPRIGNRPILLGDRLKIRIDNETDARTFAGMGDIGTVVKIERYGPMARNRIFIELAEPFGDMTFEVEDFVGFDPAQLAEEKAEWDHAMAPCDVPEHIGFGIRRVDCLTCAREKAAVRG